MLKRISGVLIDGSVGTLDRPATTITVPAGEHLTLEVDVVGQDGVDVPADDFDGGAVLTIKESLDSADPIIARTGEPHATVANRWVFEVAGGEITQGGRVYDVYLLAGEAAAFVTTPATYQVTSSAGEPSAEATPPGGGDALDEEEKYVDVVGLDGTTIVVAYDDPFTTEPLLDVGPAFCADQQITLTVVAWSTTGFSVEASAAFTGKFKYRAKGTFA